MAVCIPSWCRGRGTAAPLHPSPLSAPAALGPRWSKPAVAGGGGGDLASSRGFRRRGTLPHGGRDARGAPGGGALPAVSGVAAARRLVVGLGAAEILGGARVRRRGLLGSDGGAGRLSFPSSSSAVGSATRVAGRRLVWRAVVVAPAEVRGTAGGGGGCDGGRSSVLLALGCWRRLGVCWSARSLRGWRWCRLAALGGLVVVAEAAFGGGRRWRCYLVTVSRCSRGAW